MENKLRVFTLIHIGEVTAKNTDGHLKASPVEIKILSILSHMQVCHKSGKVKYTLKINFDDAKSSIFFCFFCI